MLTDKERLILIEHMAKITEKGDSKRVEIDFHEWAWIIELAEKALNTDEIEHNLTTAQRLKKHLDTNGKDYYKSIIEETYKIIDENKK